MNDALGWEEVKKLAQADLDFFEELLRDPDGALADRDLVMEEGDLARFKEGLASGFELDLYREDIQGIIDGRRSLGATTLGMRRRWR